MSEFYQVCPECGARIKGYERSPNGKAICEKGHRVRRNTLLTKAEPPAPPPAPPAAPAGPWDHDPDGWTRTTYIAFWDVMVEEQDALTAFDAEQRALAAAEAAEEARASREKMLEKPIASLNAEALIQFIDALDVSAFTDKGLSRMVLQRLVELDRSRRTGAKRTEAEQQVAEYAKQIEAAHLAWQPGIPPVPEQMGSIQQKVAPRTPISQEQLRQRAALEQQLRDSLAVEKAKRGWVK